MLIAQLTDTHILAKSSDRPEARSRAEDLRRCVADIGRLDPQPDIVIHTGDTVQTGAPEDYAHLEKLVAPIKQKLFATPGNRDRRDNFAVAFCRENDAFMHLSFEGLPVRLIALDSIQPPQNKGAFCAERVQWLDKTLSAAPNRPTLLFMHHPPFDMEPDYVSGYLNPGDRIALEAIISKHRQVRHLFCGHCHWISQNLWAGIKVTTTASIARDVRKGVDESRYGDTPIYQLHHVAKDGAVTTQIRHAA